MIRRNMILDGPLGDRIVFTGLPAADYLSQGVPFWYIKSVLKEMNSRREQHQLLFPGQPIVPEETS